MANSFMWCSPEEDMAQSSVGGGKEGSEERGLHLKNRLRFIIYSFYFMCMSVLLTRRHISYVHAWCLGRPGEGSRSPGNGVTDTWVLGTGQESPESANAINH